MDIQYTVNKAAPETIAEHLIQTDKQFIPPLSAKVNIKEYAEKLCTHALRLEAWSKDALVGLVAVYINDTTSKIAFITSVSVKDGSERQGIATRLLHDCMDIARKSGFRKVTLEVSPDSVGAIALYRKFNFESDGTVEGGTYTMSRYLP